ncbi:MAG: DUF92 domain-containing protein [Anaerolineales bacterium]|nr:DUF92 domain-containing protein [Anaerolineales bacterium]
MTVFQWMLGLIAAFLISIAAYRSNSLSREGKWAAFIIGTFTFGGGGLLAAVAMVTFFISASALSHIGGQRKKQIAAVFSKGGQRDRGQVLANGLTAAVFAVVYGVCGEPVWAVGAAGALAAANADTWATELGILTKGTPRLITSWRPVPPGTSGGITLPGILASLLGGALIGLVTLPFLHSWVIVLTVTAGGFAGSIFDSLLGALVQAMYWCPSCEKTTERYPMHTCGTPTTFHHGWPWLTNDGVNFAATVIGSITAIGLLLIL